MMHMKYAQNDERKKIYIYQNFSIKIKTNKDILISVKSERICCYKPDLDVVMD